MITLYHRRGNRIVMSPIPVNARLPADIAWIDVHNITPEEEKSLEAQLGVGIPTHQEMVKNRLLNRIYEENGVIYMTAAIISKTDSAHPHTSTVSILLAKDYLLTLRQIAPTSFKHFGERLLASPQKYTSSHQVLKGLLGEIITRVAFNSELASKELDALSHRIFKRGMLGENGTRNTHTTTELRELLKTLGATADLNSKINESLHSIGRLLGFLEQTQRADRDLAASLSIYSKDVAALNQQTAFHSDKITFLLDATLGMINVEQNLIIKFFSVVAAFFLPATLVSGIYGMNFDHMPELHWQGGYPFALALITLCVAAPYVYFKRKGWF